jgi:hypothetical protein
MRRRLRVTGEEPVTRYLIRISVDRYPGAPERFNAHYRAHSLTWHELALTAACRGEVMSWQVKQTATPSSKSDWCSTANTDASRSIQASPCWIDCAYTVGDDKWENGELHCTVRLLPSACLLSWSQATRVPSTISTVSLRNRLRDRGASSGPIWLMIGSLERRPRPSGRG